MAYVNQIVQFYAFGDACVIQRATVNRGIRANFDIVGNFNDACLRKLYVSSFAIRVTKSVRANHRAGMNLNAMPDSYTRIKRHPRVNAAKVANKTAGTDDCVRTNFRSFSNMRIFANYGVWADGRGCVNAGQRSNDRSRMDAPRNRNMPAQNCCGFCEYVFCACGAQNSFLRKNDSWGRNDDLCSRSSRAIG